MNAMMEAITKGALDLYQYIRSYLQQEVDSGKLSAGFRLYNSRKVEGFSYTEKGVGYSSIEECTIQKPTWTGSFKQIMEVADQSTAYSNLLMALQQYFPGRKDPDADIIVFIQNILEIFFEEKREHHQHAVKSLLWRFIRDLTEQPYNITIRMELQGIILESQTINLTSGCIIRQTIQADLETLEETNTFAASHRSHYHPSAIFEWEFELTPAFNQGKHTGNDIRSLTWRYIVLMRLYKVGSIEHQLVSRKTDIVIESNRRGGWMAGGAADPALVTYFVSKNEEAGFVEFLKSMDRLLPTDFCYSDKQITFLTIAYDRYSEALTEKSSIEKRITNVMMGLEAIFSNENMEISYRLRQRVAKLISYCGKDSLKISTIIKEGYAIRSTFSHGGTLDKKQIDKIVREHGSTDSMINSLLDILRISIVIPIVCKIEKKDLILLLDEAMVAEKKEKELYSLLKPFLSKNSTQNEQSAN